MLLAAAVPSSQLSSPLQHKYYTLQPFSTPEEIDTDASENQPPPPSLAFGPLLGTGEGKGRHDWVWEAFFLAAFRACITASAPANFPMCRLELLSDPEIVPSLQTHCALPRCTLPLRISPVPLPLPYDLPAPLLHPH